MSLGASAPRLLAVTGLAAEARIARGPGVLALAGGGDAATLAARLGDEARAGALAIISFGIAGGLRFDLAPGTCIVGDAVVSEGERVLADSAWTEALVQRLPEALRGDVMGSDRIAADCATKRALAAASSALCIDTESHLVARVARAYGVPFAVYRVVSDPAERSLPPVALVPLLPGGRVALGAVIASLVRTPQQWPAVARTAADAARARRRLLEGRRRLGAYFAYPDLGKLLLDVA